ncbi:YecA family protein [Alkalibacterium gilvum]|uniref:YecA family protein n=1 Tax=Alkalibacterium gilvum TaxID=1130080 RepID=UPI003F8E6CDF
MRKFKKNGPCPCGSGKKYRNCHYKNNGAINKTDNIINNYKSEFVNLHKNKRIKECNHPNKTECSDKIINAHSIQNNRIIKQLSENGIVYMNKAKSSKPFALFTKWGRKEATTFTGFCNYHDKITFHPIEDYNFNGSDEHIFLHTYRCMIHNFHEKREYTIFSDSLTGTHSLGMNSAASDIGIGFKSAVKDFLYVKDIFDSGLLNRDYSILHYIIWEFDYPISFAGSSFEAPTKDLYNNKIQNLRILDTRASHIYITIFPENDKSYCIISWLKEDSMKLESLTEQLSGLDFLEKRHFLNRQLVKNSDNLVFSPKLIDFMSPDERDNFGFMSQGSFLFDELYDSIDDEDVPILISDPMYDLFKNLSAIS